MQTILQILLEKFACGQASVISVNQAFYNRSDDEIAAFVNECPNDIKETLGGLGFPFGDAETFTLKLGYEDALGARLLMEVANNLSMEDIVKFGGALEQ